MTEKKKKKKQNKKNKNKKKKKNNINNCSSSNNNSDCLPQVLNVYSIANGHFVLIDTRDAGKGSLSNLGIEQNLPQKLVQKYARGTVLEFLRDACTSTDHLLLYMCLDATQPNKLALTNSHFSPSVTFSIQQLEYIYHSRCQH